MLAAGLRISAFGAQGCAAKQSAQSEIPGFHRALATPSDPGGQRRRSDAGTKSGVADNGKAMRQFLARSIFLSALAAWRSERRGVRPMDAADGHESLAAKRKEAPPAPAATTAALPVRPAFVTTTKV